MNLEKLTIEGYKSIGKIEIVKPNPFTVFVGPNASGKSNIFEAIELLALGDVMQENHLVQLYGTFDELFCRLSRQKIITVDSILSTEEQPKINLYLYIPEKIADTSFSRRELENPSDTTPPIRKQDAYIHFVNFTRLFVGNTDKTYYPRNDDSRLNTNASNLEKVLKRILKDENKREEIFEILQLLIPGFERVEIVSSELSGTDTLIVYETALKKPLTKELISDGTYNILSIIAALYQSDEPQFLCIEEPENGINPFVVKELVDIIRDICEEKGHYVWLNTHSQSLVSVLTKEEIIIVDKKNGLTEIKQIPDMDLHGLRMDDALYTNSIGGGNPW